MIIKKTVCILIGLGYIISGCTNTDSARVGSSVDENFLNAYDALEKSKNPTSEISNDTVSSSDGVWLGDTAIVLPYKNNLPSMFESENGITLYLKDKTTLPDLANTINQLTGIPVNVDKQIDSAKLSNEFNVSYTGPLSKLLNQVATDTDTLWYYDRYKIVFYETETKTFSLHALGTDVNYSADVSGDDDSNFVKLSSKLEEWAEIDRTLQQMTKDSNATYEISSSTGTVTVTASPDMLDRIEKYINRQNKIFSQQIAINVRVLQVTIENSNAFGLNLSAAVESVSGLQLVSTPVNNMSTVGNSLNLAILNNNVKSAAGLLPVDPDTGLPDISSESYITPAQIADSSLGNLAGTDALIQALAKQGKISLLTSATVTTRNNRVAPVKNMRSTAYIKSIGSVLGTLGGSESNIVPDSVDTGFSMQLLPNIIDNSKVMLLFKMSIKDLIKISTFSSSNGATVQLPEIDERAFMQEVVMESGQTLVLTGFEQMKNNDTRYGIGDADFMALGGSRETSSSRDVLVVIITPQVLVSPMDPEKGILQKWGSPLN